MWTFQGWVLKACDEVCVKKRRRRSKGDAWWWNEEVKEAASRKKEAHKAMRQDCTDKRRYKSMKNKAMRQG